MNKREFDIRVREFISEIEHQAGLIGNPEHILGELFVEGKPNLLLQFFTASGYTDSEICDVIVEQLYTLQPFSRCRISKAGDGIRLKVDFQNPDMTLFLIDIENKRYGASYKAVERSIDDGIRAAEAKREKIRENIGEVQAIIRSVIQITGGDFTLYRAKGQRIQLKKYLASLTYSEGEIEDIIRDIKGYLDSCQGTLDKRQAVLAQAEGDLANCIAEKRRYNENALLQGVIQDIMGLLQRSGYTVI